MLQKARALKQKGSEDARDAGTGQHRRLQRGSCIGGADGGVVVVVVGRPRWLGVGDGARLRWVSFGSERPLRRWLGFLCL